MKNLKCQFENSVIPYGSQTTLVIFHNNKYDITNLYCHRMYSSMPTSILNTILTSTTMRLFIYCGIESNQWYQIKDSATSKIKGFLGNSRIFFILIDLSFITNIPKVHKIIMENKNLKGEVL